MPEPVAVGTASALSRAAIAANDKPSTVRSWCTRCRIAGDWPDGGPMCWPWAVRVAIASLIRSPMRRRSSSANATATCAIAAPVGVEVSTLRSRHTSAQPCLPAWASRAEKSATDRETRSRLATARASNRCARRSSSAAANRGRPTRLAPDAACSCTIVSDQPRRSAAACRARTCAAAPVSCMSVLTRT